MSTDLKFSEVGSGDEKNIELIARWYELEWNMPYNDSVEKIRNLAEPSEFQILASKNNLPVATGGIYQQVGIVKKFPQFALHKHWLALMYTIQPMRGLGIGAELVKHIIDEAKKRKIKEVFLFTHTAESLYERLGWRTVENVAVADKKVVVMKLEL